MVTKKNIDTLEALWKHLKNTEDTPDQKWIKRCLEIIHNTPSRTLVFNEVMERLYRVSEKMSILGREDLEVPLLDACKLLEQKTTNLKEEFLHAQFLTILLELSRNPLEIRNAQFPSKKEDFQAETESRLMNEELRSLSGDHWEEQDWMEITSEEEVDEEEGFGDLSVEKSQSSTLTDEKQTRNVRQDDSKPWKLHSLTKITVPYVKNEATAGFKRLKPFMFFHESSNLEDKDVSERWFVKDVIYMLLGLPSFFFHTHDTGTVEVRHQMLPKVKMLTHKLMYSILDVFANYGSCLNNYRNLLKSLSENNVSQVNINHRSEIVRKERIFPYLGQPLETCLKELQKRLHKLESEIYQAMTKSTLFQAYIDLSPIIFCLTNYLKIFNTSNTVWDVVEKLDILKQQKREEHVYNFLFKSSCTALIRWLFRFVGYLHAEKIPQYVKKTALLMKQLNLEKDGQEEVLQDLENSSVYESTFSFAAVLLQLEVYLQARKTNLPLTGIERKVLGEFTPLSELNALIQKYESAKDILLLKEQSKLTYGHFVFIRTCLEYFMFLQNEMQKILSDESDLNSDVSFFGTKMEPYYNGLGVEAVVERFLQDVFTEDVLEILQHEALSCQQDVFANIMEKIFSTDSPSTSEWNETNEKVQERCDIFVKLSNILLHPDRPVDPGAYCCRRRFSELLLLIVPEV
ncbi:gamma tubulin complex subunit Mod21 [Schizosaccharomyces cryophilus OY26]|uniref:Gamma tubulin complex subunit Mod21 n=1 Tax=Schizosaccharomyces cryophilus (strain OY26 / ATCC MYA-4695 / CBS 11777 / NBRC 106824 / NRRL Y48691) TaxID=653667 RepID=S9X6D6_SCHCR|nr:gamma tubulin complex subunit Mod21 [Schizosaccharomyces cryophilus OY26]EPY52667.1 gamma tubulin complex subunit Mod21 [Schizosaccharomyces cryophilus OY26]